MEVYKLCTYCCVMSIQILWITWNSFSHEFMLFFLAWRFFLKWKAINFLWCGDLVIGQAKWMIGYGFGFCKWQSILYVGLEHYHLEKYTPLRKMFWTTGHTWSSRISWYLIALIFLFNSVTVPGPNKDIHPHIITSNFGRGLWLI